MLKSERPIVSDVLDSGFRCEPASNGGWVIWDNRPGTGYQPVLIAAFSSSEELVKGIAQLLSAPPATPLPTVGIEGTVQ